MNVPKVDELMDLHYECRKHLQKAKEADLDKREAENSLIDHRVRDSAEITNQFLKKAQLSIQQREYHLQQYAETMDKMEALIGEAKPPIFGEVVKLKLPIAEFVMAE